MQFASCLNCNGNKLLAISLLLVCGCAHKWLLDWSNVKWCLAALCIDPLAVRHAQHEFCFVFLNLLLVLSIWQDMISDLYICVILDGIIQLDLCHHYCGLSLTCMQLICGAGVVECNIRYVCTASSNLLCECCMAPPEFSYQNCY